MTSSVLNILTVSILVGWSMYGYFTDKHFRKQYNKELERIRKQYEEELERIKNNKKEGTE